MTHKRRINGKKYLRSCRIPFKNQYRNKRDDHQYHTVNHPSSTLLSSTPFHIYIYPADERKKIGSSQEEEEDEEDEEPNALTFKKWPTKGTSL